MAVVKWTKDLSVGDTDIDHQHQELLEMVSKLYFRVSGGHTEDLTVSGINDLLTFAWNHFQTEEEMFRRVNFPEAADHIKEHEGFVNTVTEFRTRFTTREENVFPALLGYLNEWLDDHLKEKDQKYAPYVRARKPSGPSA